MRRKTKGNQYRFHNISRSQLKSIRNRRRLSFVDIDEKYRYYQALNKYGNVRGVLKESIDGNTLRYKRVRAARLRNGRYLKH